MTMELDKELQLIRNAPQSILFEGATLQELKATEQIIGRKLPQSYKWFLQATNGAVLYQTETIFGTKDGSTNQTQDIQESLVRVKQALKLPEYLVPFYQGAEVHFFDTRFEENQEYPVVVWNDQSAEVIPIAKSFPEWLGRYILAEFE